MTLASVITTKVDVDKLRAFVKLPENKLWLGRVSRFYTELEASPAITDPEKVKTIGLELKTISEEAAALLKAAREGCDTDDADLLDRFSLKLMEQILKNLSPEMMIAAGFGGKQ